MLFRLIIIGQLLNAINSLLFIDDLLVRPGDMTMFCAATECRKTSKDIYCKSEHYFTSPHFSRKLSNSHFLMDVGGRDLNVTGISVNADNFFMGEVSRPGFSMSISTSSDFISLPESLFNEIEKILKPLKGPENKSLVSCSLMGNSFPIQLVINGNTVSINSVNYIQPIGLDVCELKIRKSSDNTYSFGEPFTDSVGLCFDFSSNHVIFYDVSLMRSDDGKRKHTSNVRKRETRSDGVVETETYTSFEHSTV